MRILATCLIVLHALFQSGEKNAPVVLIRAAVFEMGTNAAEIPRLQDRFGIKRADIFAAESPRHTVTLSAFYIDKYEVTNARYKRFIDSKPDWRRERIPPSLHNGNYLAHGTGNTFPKDKANHPVVNVSWYAAVAYCRWEGKRLPTEAEWEYAARGGTEDRAFPWGDDMPDKPRVNFRESGFKATTTVGTYSPNYFGLFDMAGNVWEYVADEWAPYTSATQVDPVAGGNLFAEGTAFRSVTSRRVIRGGSWGGAPVNLRVAYRDSHRPDDARDFVGFRCAKPVRQGKSRTR